jgi:uncharacterized ion transporter superfamily protein YfcC
MTFLFRTLCLLLQCFFYSSLVHAQYPHGHARFFKLGQRIVFLCAAAVLLGVILGVMVTGINRTQGAADVAAYYALSLAVDIIGMLSAIAFFVYTIALFRLLRKTELGRSHVRGTAMVVAASCCVAVASVIPMALRIVSGAGESKAV